MSILCDIFVSNLLPVFIIIGAGALLSTLCSAVTLTVLFLIIG